MIKDNLRKFFGLLIELGTILYILLKDFTNPSLPPGEPGADIITGAGGLMNANDLLLLAARQRQPLTGDKIVNGLMGNGGPGVIPQFALGIGAPLTGAYSSGIPSLSAFTLTNTGLTS
uniref:Uncharacterized protein n=1 Tax=Megaselia scalaris TaxID=36166 RepID=T1GS36_MEGSC